MTVAANESGDVGGKDGLFASVNDSIRKLAAANDPDAETWDFFCECPDIACRAVVSLTVDEFDERRAASPRVPVLAADHAVRLSA
jgi:hypothetical protein